MGQVGKEPAGQESWQGRGLGKDLVEKGHVRSMGFELFLNKMVETFRLE